MIVRIFVLLAVVTTMLQYEFAAETLAATVGFFAFLYYWLVLNVVAGLKTMSFTWKDHQMMHDASIAGTTNAIAAITLILLTPYAYIGYIALPWICITTGLIVFGWLLHLEIIEINTVENEKSDD